jgi:hypothetical protein
VSTQRCDLCRKTLVAPREVYEVGMAEVCWDCRCQINEPEHGEERGRHYESEWHGKDAVLPGGTVLPGVLGSGFTQTVSERWCAHCRQWNRVAGVLGPIMWHATHDDGECVQRGHTGDPARRRGLA